MKCISLWQPWSSLMVWDEKRIETRSWPTKYRGDMLLHASKHWDEELSQLILMEPFYSALSRHIPGYSSLTYGELIGKCHLAECVPTAICEVVDWLKIGYQIEESAKTGKVVRVLISPQEYAFGNYEAGRFAWLTDSAKPLGVPIPYRGQQGLFDIPDDVLEVQS